MGALIYANGENYSKIASVVKKSISNDLLTENYSKAFRSLERYRKDYRFNSIAVQKKSVVIFNSSLFVERSFIDEILEKTMESSLDIVNDIDGSKAKYRLIFSYPVIMAPYRLLLILVAIFFIIYYIFKRLENFEIERERVERESEIASWQIETNRQLAHDIRSPLTALSMVISELEGLTQLKRRMVETSVNRIHDIANGLLNRERIGIGGEAFLVSIYIERLITEKREQYKGISDKVNIKASFDEESYFLFSSIDYIEFQRILSNLINNAVEASQDLDGEVLVELSKTGQYAEVKIEDRGKGIPFDILKRLNNEEQLTFGKKNGNGIGLAHAREVLKKAQGLFKIDSLEGEGTCVKIKIPIVSDPQWFCSEIFLKKTVPIIILDDDLSIHDLWRERLKGLDLNIYFFISPDEFMSFISQLDDFLLLFDLCLKENRIDEFVEKFKLSEKSILITNFFEDKKIRNYCHNLGMKIVPKELLGKIPLHLIKTELYDAVFLDNEEILRRGWEVEAKEKGISLLSTDSIQVIKNSLKKFGSYTQFYIDHNLGNKNSGLEVCRWLWSMGFREIFLATGYEPQNYRNISYIKSVVGKRPPWN